VTSPDYTYLCIINLSIEVYDLKSLLKRSLCHRHISWMKYYFLYKNVHLLFNVKWGLTVPSGHIIIQDRVHYQNSVLTLLFGKTIFQDEELKVFFLFNTHWDSLAVFSLQSLHHQSIRTNCYLLQFSAKKRLCFQLFRYYSIILQKKFSL